MHTAEKHLVKALPLVAKAAKSEDIKALFNLYLEETKGHVKTIEQIAGFLDQELPRKSCPAMTGLIKEAMGLLVGNINEVTRDKALITGRGLSGSTALSLV